MLILRASFPWASANIRVGAIADATAVNSASWCICVCVPLCCQFRYVCHAAIHANLLATNSPVTADRGKLVMIACTPNPQSCCSPAVTLVPELCLLIPDSSFSCCPVRIWRMWLVTSWWQQGALPIQAPLLLPSASYCSRSGWLCCRGCQCLTPLAPISLGHYR